MKISQLFDRPALYKLFQFAISTKDSRNLLKNEVIKPEGIESILDFGCGIGNMSQHFPNSKYLGIEPLQKCVDSANKRYANDMKHFIVGNQLTLKSLKSESFDLIIAIGVLHHMNDNSAQEFFQEAKRILRRGGRITTFDPYLYANQNTLAKFVIMRDRGTFVRTELEYLELTHGQFEHFETRRFSNLLRIPYDHLVIDFFPN